MFKFLAGFLPDSCQILDNILHDISSMEKTPYHIENLLGHSSPIKRQIRRLAASFNCCAITSLKSVKVSSTNLDCQSFEAQQFAGHCGSGDSCKQLS